MLEEQEVIPLGGEVPVKVDLRVVCASHQNLRAMLARSQFREDLYYRLNGITLELPPLAQRTDKERLIREFVAAETNDGRPVAIEMDAYQRLLAYDWPGNIRQLRNVIRTALAICDGGVVRLRDLPSEVRDGAVRKEQNRTDATEAAEAEAPTPVGRTNASDRGTNEREKVLQAVHDSKGNMSRAAQCLGISRTTLYRHCRQLGIAPRHTNGVARDWQSDS